MAFIPETEEILTGGAIILLAVFLWMGSSLLRGSNIDLLETLFFAFVFAFLYFSGLSLLTPG